MKSLPLALLRTWAFIGVVIAYIVFVFGSYRYALAHGGLPYTMWEHWPVFYVVAFLVLSGLGALALLNIRRLRLQPLVAGVLGRLYVVVMSVILFALHLVVACANGDCL